MGLCDANRSMLLALPGLPELEDAALAANGMSDPPALFLALLDLQRRFGEELAAPLEHTLERCRPQWLLAWPDGAGDRALTATAWSWLGAAGDVGVRAEAAAAVAGPSMTLARAGLRASSIWPSSTSSAIWHRKSTLLAPAFASLRKWPHHTGICTCWPVPSRIPTRPSPGLPPTDSRPKTASPWQSSFSGRKV